MNNTKDFLRGQEVSAKKHSSTSDFSGMVGKKIREAREEMKLSQPAFGKKVGQSGATIRSWEKGDTSPRITDMHKISGVTKKSIAWFIGIEQPPNHNGTEADVDEAVFNTGGLASVKTPPSEKETAHAYPGFAVRGGGRDQLVIDLVIRGRKDRAVIIDVGAREEDADG